LIDADVELAGVFAGLVKHGESPLARIIHHGRGVMTDLGRAGGAGCNKPMVVPLALGIVHQMLFQIGQHPRRRLERSIFPFPF
jgi:hypothetical protein